MKDINNSEFSEATQLKLGIFRECFREWYPVFLHNKFIKGIYIYDMFAGSGSDLLGNPGSPLILIQEIRGDKQQHCTFKRMNSVPTVYLAFNEYIQEKAQKLEKNIEREFSKCKESCSLADCIFKGKYFVENLDFQSIKENNRFRHILENNTYAKFIILDQYGFKQINDDVFQLLINSPKTDFIFFIASSFIRRFQKVENVKKYFSENEISFKETEPNECHRIITNYFRKLVPQDKEYYIHSFTIKKETNYYGLIFGSNHSLGMEKFLKVCWKKDPRGGESNCNINNDYEEHSLFSCIQPSNKKKEVTELIQQEILNKKITTNRQGLKFALKNGCEPKIFVTAVEDLIQKRKIRILGKFNKVGTNIHRAPQYNIELI